MRNKFIEVLVEEARNNDKLVLIIGDLGYNVVEPFQEQFPDRFFNVGICEQNMASMAAGLSSEGFHVFIYLGPMSSGLLLDICSLEIEWKIINTSISYGSLIS